MLKSVLPGFAVAVVCATTVFAEVPTVHGFSPSTIYPRQDSVLTIEVQNDLLAQETGVGFTKQLPAGLTFAEAGPNIRTTCNLNPATVVSTSGNDSFSLSDATIPASDGVSNGSCTVSLDVSGIVESSYELTIQPGDVTSDSGQTNPDVSSASLAVIVTAPTIGVGLNYIANGPNVGGGTRWVRGGTEVNLSLSLWNENPVDLQDGQFTYIFDDGLTPVAGATVTTSGCGAPEPNMVLNAGGLGSPASLTVTGARLLAAAPGASTQCIFNVPTILATDRYQPSSNFGVNNIIFPAGALTTSEGTTNESRGFNWIRPAVGIGFTKSFNPSLLAIALSDTTELTIDARSNDAEAIALSPVVDQLPEGLEYVSAVPDSCGGSAALTSSTPGGAVDTLTVTGATVPGVTWSGSYLGECRIATATVRVIGSDSSYTNTIPAGVTGAGDYRYNAASATLDVSNAVLSVAKTFGDVSNIGTNVRVNATEATSIIFVLTNPTSQTLTDVTFSDRWDEQEGNNQYINNFRGALRVAGAPTFDGCGPSAAVDAPMFGVYADVSGVTIAPNSSCTIEVPLRMSAYGLWRTQFNIVRAENITHSFAGSTDRIAAVNDMVQRLDSGGLLGFRMYLTPNRIAQGGITRAEIRFTTTDVSDLDNLDGITTLSSHLVAPVPNTSTNCVNGVLHANPGESSIRFTGGLQAGESCSIWFDIISPAEFIFPSRSTFYPFRTGLTGESVQLREFLAANQAAADAAGLTSDFYSFSVRPGRVAYLYKVATQVIPSISFIDPVTGLEDATIGGGGIGRMRVVISNTQSASINLTDMSLTDVLPPQLRLATNADPTYTNTSGNPNANGCTGGTFSTNPDRSSITLNNATISRLGQCHFEFNVTSDIEGNWENTIEPGDITTREGVTNDLAANATIAVEGDFGAIKGFNPPLISDGQTSELVIEVINTTETLLNGRAIASLTDTLPLGLEVVPGTLVTTCIGATVTETVLGGGETEITLNGGQFGANSTCEITVTVSAVSEGPAYVNTIPAGAMVLDSGAVSDEPTTATLTVIPQPTIQIAFLPDSILAGDTSRLRFTITNPVSRSVLPGGLTGAGFTNTLTNMTVADNPNVSSTCTGLVPAVAAGDTSLAFTDFGIPGSTCRIEVNVTSAIIGSHPNVTSGVTTDQTALVGDPSNSASLTVAPQPTVAPNAINDFALDQDFGPVTLNITNNDTDLNDDLNVASVTFVGVDGAGNPLTAGADLVVANEGTWRVDSFGNVTFTPVPNYYSNPTQIRYTVFDAGGRESNAAWITVRYIESPEILAGSEDPRAPIVFNAAAQSGGNVLDAANDTIGGVAADPSAAGNVLLRITSIDPALTVDTATGEITVAANTPAGSYGVTYVITDPVNPTNTATATETIVVSPVIAAGSEDPRAPIVFNAAAQSGGNVLDAANDTMNGFAADPTAVTGNVVLSITSIDPALTVNTATGEITVAANTPAGSYGVTYVLTDPTDPTSSATATETIVVSPVIAAGSEDPRAPIMVNAAAQLGGNVLDAANDTIGGVAADPSAAGNVLLSIDNIDPALTVDTATGEITVAANTPAGSYGVTYVITDPVNPANTATATETIVVYAPQIALVSTATQIDDTNGNGQYGDAGDTINYRFTVENTGNTALAGVRIDDTGFDGLAGTYTFTVDPSFDGDLAVNEGMVTIGFATYEITPSDMSVEEIVIQPTVTSFAVASDTNDVPMPNMSLFFDGNGLPLAMTDASDTGSEPMPNREFGMVPAIANPAQTGTDADPTVLMLIVPGEFVVAKSTASENVLIGDTLSYEIVATSMMNMDFGPALVVDTLPAGMAIVPGSAMVDGITVTPDVSGRSVSFSNLIIPANGSVTITLQTRVLASAPAGDLINLADLLDQLTGEKLSRTASAVVSRTVESTFDCSPVIGKVFDDVNGNGYQDAFFDPTAVISNHEVFVDGIGGKGKLGDAGAHQNEVGIPGVRLVTPSGTIITTDAHGRYSVPCAELPRDIGGNFMLKLDTRSLPTGYRVTTENPRVMRLTRGLMTEMNFGAAIGRVLDVKLTKRAYDGATVAPSQALNDGLETLLRRTADTPTLIRLNYYANQEDAELAQARLDAVETLIQDQWRKIGNAHIAIEKTAAKLR